MFTNLPTWTTDRVELLKSHFEAGLTCREIAASIGVSRNAVIGKLARLELTRGPAKGRTAPGQDRQGALQEIHPPAAVSDPAGRLRKRAAAQEEPIASERRCSLFELSDERCRWPISTPGAEDFCFCGNTPVEGMPYCSGHHRLAYRPARASAL